MLIISNVIVSVDMYITYIILSSSFKAKSSISYWEKSYTFIGISLPSYIWHPLLITKYYRMLIALILHQLRRRRTYTLSNSIT